MNQIIQNAPRQRSRRHGAVENFKLTRAPTSALQSFVPNMMGKAAWYAIPAAQYLPNVTKVAEPLQRKQYPGSWWKPRMIAQADRIGKREEVLLALNVLQHRA